MPAASIFSPEQRKFIHRAYLTEGHQTATVTELLNKRFGTSFQKKQVQRHINVRLSQRRKVMVERRGEVGIKSDAQIARENAAKSTAVLAGFAEKTRKVTDKALDMALGARDARTMSAATSAAKAGLTMFRVCAGLEGPSTGPRAVSFNFAFASVQPTIAGQQPAVEVQVTETRDEDDETGDE